MSFELPVSNIAFIGCGNMGQAILTRWAHRFSETFFHIFKPSPLPERFQDYGRIKHYTDLSDLETIAADMIILAVKPQMMSDICEQLQNYVSQNTIIITIAASLPLSLYETYFHEDTCIIRTMPNTPSMLGHGITLITAKNLSGETQQLTDTLFDALGQTFWCKSEEELEKAAILSSCGPAYIFQLCETLAKAGSSLGLIQDMAEALARQTVIGSALLLKKEADTPPETLKHNVMSKGGLTEAAIERLNAHDDLNALFKDAFQIAWQRNQDLKS